MNNKSQPYRQITERHLGIHTDLLERAEDEDSLNFEELQVIIENAMLTFGNNLNKIATAYQQFRVINGRFALGEDVPLRQVNIRSIYTPHPHYYTSNTDFVSLVRVLFEEIVPLFVRLCTRSQALVNETLEDRNYVAGLMTSLIKWFPEYLSVQFGQQIVRIGPESTPYTEATIMMAIMNSKRIVGQRYIDLTLEEKTLYDERIRRAEEYAMYLFENTEGITDFGSCVTYYHQLMITHQRDINQINDLLNQIESNPPISDISDSSVITDNDIDWSIWIQERRL